jgi:hypothetical protein
MHSDKVYIGIVRKDLVFAEACTKMNSIIFSCVTSPRRRLHTALWCISPRLPTAHSKRHNITIPHGSHILVAPTSDDGTSNHLFNPASIFSIIVHHSLLSVRPGSDAGLAHGGPGSLNCASSPRQLSPVIATRRRCCWAGPRPASLTCALPPGST